MAGLSDSSYTLSLAAVDILSQTLGVNLRLFPFEIPSFGRLEKDRVGIARAVFLDLAKRGMIRRGDVEPELRRALHTLASFQVAVAALGTIGADRQLFARASATAETGVLAVQEGQQLRVELIRPTALAMTMVGLLPALDAGPGQSVTLAKPATPAAPAAVGARDDYFANVRGPRLSDPMLRMAESYLSRPRVGSGFFAVSGRDRHGKEFRAGEIGWFDTDAGRYLNLSRPPDDSGTVYGTISPADPVRLTQQLGALIQSAGRG